MQMIETPRLVLRRLTEDDAPFICGLLNEPSFLENIGDRGVRSEGDAVTYLRDGPIAMYERHGFGLLLTSLRADTTPIGMCGILKRDGLDDPDIGYALLPAFWGQGFAVEAARAVIDEALKSLDLPRVLAITKPDNVGSIRVLERLGFQFERIMRVTPDGPENRLFSLQLRERRLTEAAGDALGKRSADGAEQVEVGSAGDAGDVVGRVRLAKGSDVPALVALMSAFTRRRATRSRSMRQRARSISSSPSRVWAESS